MCVTRLITKLVCMADELCGVQEVFGISQICQSAFARACGLSVPKLGVTVCCGRMTRISPEHRVDAVVLND